MREDNKARYRLIKAGEHGQSLFVDITDEHAVEAVRNRFGNRYLLISAHYYTGPDFSGERIYPLRFHIISPNVEQARISTLEGCYYLNERLSIPLNSLEITLTGVGDIVGHGAVDGYHADRNNHKAGHIIGRDASDHCGQDRDTTNYCAGENDKTGDGGESNYGLANTGRENSGKTSISAAASDNSQIAGTDIMGATTTAEMIITVPPIVFGGWPTPLMPAMNYHLARQMTEDGIGSLDIDVYQRDRFVHLPNSINTLTGRYVIPLLIKELLYLDGETIAELARKPKAEDSLAIPRFIPEAAEWFAETWADFEKKQCQQDKLRKWILQKDWQIPPCIRRLSWADLAKDATLEACRVISGTYSFLGSHEDEIWHHILRLARRSSIQGVREHQKLRAIITLALENPRLPECSHLLVKRFCPAGGCYISGLLEDCRKPGLFEGLSKAYTQL